MFIEYKNFPLIETDKLESISMVDRGKEFVIAFLFDNNEMLWTFSEKLERDKVFFGIKEKLKYFQKVISIEIQ